MKTAGWTILFLVFLGAMSSGLSGIGPTWLRGIGAVLVSFVLLFILFLLIRANVPDQKPEKPDHKKILN